MTDKTILYIEDNADNAYMLSRRLQRKGYSVVVAVDGAKGVETARSLQPDIILMDLDLPVMDGWAASGKLKSLNATRHIPIIAVSSHVLPDDRQNALTAGCDEYETKPIDFERLLRKIRALEQN
ncbi:MAG: response regulator [Granulosicoccus sp.]|nr:response regulator [Granulosicoccus sp.]